MRVSKQWDQEAMRRQMYLERTNTIRPVFTRGRQLENNVDFQSLNVVPISLVDPLTGNFFFTPGFSTVGGPDVVRP